MIVLVLIVLGLILGSFINALIWRLHTGKDWVNGRSECTHCHHVLASKDLIPVISWLWLRGKCRYCHKKIDDNPLVELSLPTLYVASYVWWPVALTGAGTFAFVVWCACLVGFVALAAYDFRWLLLPNKLVFPLIGLAVVQVIVLTICQHDWHIALTALLGAVIVSGTFYVLFQLSKGAWIGGGDVKLGIVLGALAGGALESFLLLFAASALAMIAMIPAFIRGKAHRKTQVPFGPFLIGGLIVVKLFGATIIGWYGGLFYA